VKDKDVSVQCYHRYQSQIEGDYVGDRCKNEVIKKGYVYCEKHFELYHSEQYNSRLDSGSGLVTTSRVLQ